MAVPQEEADRLRVSVLLALVLAEALRDGEGEERGVREATEVGLTTWPPPKRERRRKDASQ